MKKSVHFAVCILLTFALLLCACAGPEHPPADVPPEPPATTAPPRRTAPAAPPTDYVTAGQMALADPFAGSDEAALAAVMRKAEAGETVTVAVIGGSITQGTISKGSADSQVKKKQMYAEIFRDWWVKSFPNTRIEFINAGIGATDSYLAVHRVQKDVLDYDPDLVLVEFSVNDGNTSGYQNTYENLLRKILLDENHPAVLLLFLAQTNGASAQQVHSLAGFNYSLPMVSYKNVMDAMLEEDTYTAAELSGDQVHPSALGHRIVGEILWKYLNGIYEAMDSYDPPAEFDTAPVTNDRYVNNPRILDSTTATPADFGTFGTGTVFHQFPNSWSTSEGGSITFELTFRNLGILYYCQTDGQGGLFEVYVDGQRVSALNADFSGGWGNYAATQEVYTSGEAAPHTVVLRKAANSPGDAFTLLGLLVSE